ncbi:MAG: [Clostridia bacterium]|nr:[FeFe] hydrogenase H-cluster radical SAM maturase HydE [Clostridia bacterium]
MPFEKLCKGQKLSLADFETLIQNRAQYAEDLQKLAKEKTEEIFGKKIYIRGLVEITNICKNDCLYCGIRKSNKNVNRYRLTDAEVLSCCEAGYKAGFKTFVLQGGEGDIDYLPLIREIKKRYPDCALTLSLGEKTYEEYKAWFDAGADRYLLRHETADCTHYQSLHPKNMLLENRMNCLADLKEIGYQTGCGFMVGSPNQTEKTLAKDLHFIQEFQPHMVGIGPFIPQKDTPFGREPAGSIDLTLYLLSVLRLMIPNLLLPATTALGSLKDGGREEGILHGANVVMPNISPDEARKNYTLYNNKLYTGAEAKEGLALLAESLKKIDREIAFERGDYKQKN